MFEINIFLFLSIIFIATLLLGLLLEKIHIPWVFAALLFGFAFAFYNPFYSLTTSSTFTFLSQLGMYLLLFIIGFEINLENFKERSNFIIRSSFFIILFEAIFGSLLIFFLFRLNLFISIVLGISFSTVGEAILIPILDKNKVTKTQLGQTIIGIGCVDDIIEIIMLFVVIILVGPTFQENFNMIFIILTIVILFVLTIGFIKLQKKGRKFQNKEIETVFLLALFVLFLFVGIGFYSEAASLGALLAGIGIRNFIPKERIENIESEIKTMCYGLFAPIFFFSVGVTMEPIYFVIAWSFVPIIVGVSCGAKILSSIITGKKELGTKNSVLLGIGLTVRFSTSIVIVTLLFKYGLITNEVFSILIGSSMVFTIITPIIFSYLLERWTSAKTNGSLETHPNKII